MKELIEGLTIMYKYYPDLAWPTNCSHDELRVMCDPSKFTKEEILLLSDLGFEADLDDGNFYSFKYGSC